MGRVVDGRWDNTDLGADARGRYVRRATVFRGQVRADPEAEWPAESGRYHLFVSHACGWSHRTLLFRALRGLEGVVPVHYVEPFMGEDGWTFGEGGDPLGARQFLWQLFTDSDPAYTGRASVPVLWDAKTSRIVSNESKDIVRAFDSEFAAFARQGASLFPAERADEIDAMIEANYTAVNNGVYRAGFAGNQAAYSEAVDGLFARLDELETLLGRQRYLLGNEITAADWYLFPTLYRFDAVYYIHFKCCLRRLVDYPNLWGFTRDLYQQPGIAETCRLDLCREHYYTSHESIHPRRYVPSGPNPEFDAPHERASVGAV